MPNYYARTRSSYFHVKDAEAFKETMNRIAAMDFEVFEEDVPGSNRLAFGCCDTIIPECQIEMESEEDVIFTNFAALLQPHLPEGEVVIVQETGYEAMRYVVGAALIITADQVNYLNLQDLAIESARNLVGDPKRTIKTDY